MFSLYPHAGFHCAHGLEQASKCMCARMLAQECVFLCLHVCVCMCVCMEGWSSLSLFPVLFLCCLGAFGNLFVYLSGSKVTLTQGHYH